MLRQLKHFEENIARARELGLLSTVIARLTSDAVDLSDLWRSQVLLGVSALDHFIHEITRAGIVEIAKGARAKTDTYLAFHVPLKSVERALAGDPHDEWLDEAVRERLSWSTFQRPDKIADALRIISKKPLWESIAITTRIPVPDLKKRLELIVDRRNKIAHEADMDPANPGFRWPISASTATDTLDFIEQIAKAIATEIA